MLEQLMTMLRDISLLEAFGLLLVENLIVAALGLALGHLLVARYAGRPVAGPPPVLSQLEVALSILTISINTLVTVVGLYLWREGIIRFRTDVGPGVLLDIVLLILIMDLAMYILHRVAHIRWLFPWLHRTHHAFDRPRPLTLFVLNPFETLSFGLLWLAVISVYPASWLGMSVYLALNVLFGVIGHLGVEPLPDRWKRLPLLRHLSTSTFHAGHHDDLAYNYGFYTLIWDRLFGTLAPDYDERFGRMPKP
jgi:sterol desaturase/sphingolipid hydroxylase (fatty acid hydroxylase superfamily)